MPKIEVDKDLVIMGAELRRKRNLRKLTQEQLAPLVSNTARTIGKIERGEDNVPFLTLKKMVDYLEVSLDSLFHPAETQEEREIQDLIGLYRSCPKGKRPVLMAMVHTLVEQLKSLEG